MVCNAGRPQKNEIMQVHHAAAEVPGSLVSDMVEIPRPIVTA